MTVNTYRRSTVFDAGPLQAFAVVASLDLLATLFVDCALWTTEVHHEISIGAKNHAHLTPILRQTWLGDPIRAERPQLLLNIERTRIALGGTATSTGQHLGEASTLVIAQEHNAIAALDDRDGRILAGARNIPYVGTIGILQSACRGGVTTPNEAWALYQDMRCAGRWFPDLTRADFEDGS